jgi:ADP-ribosylglycohydrolase
VSIERSAMMSGTMTPSRRDRFLGCLLGGAAGDALGAPVEFMKRPTILARFGPRGIATYAPAYGLTGAITDDTQMTLFTAEGLLRAYVRGQSQGICHGPSVVAHAYLRWLKTQGTEPAAPNVGEDGWLYARPELHQLRAPGRTCVHSLSLMQTFGDVAENGSKGCGSVMRMAPAGLFAARSGHAPDVTFQLGCELAALTHGHPTGQLTAGVLAVLIAEICGGAPLPDALDTAVAQLITRPAHVETLDALTAARTLAGTIVPRDVAVGTLGEGWIAEEALAIAVYCALVAADFEDGVVLAVNHSGDSDSTGAIAGNILGALLGVDAIPPRWLDGLELRDAITQIAIDLDAYPDWRVASHLDAPDTAILERYPGW